MWLSISERYCFSPHEIQSALSKKLKHVSERQQWTVGDLEASCILPPQLPSPDIQWSP